MGVAVPSDSYFRYAICERMGWDYYTFENQPRFFLEEIMIFVKQESSKQKADEGKATKDIPNTAQKGYSRN